jgi:hypothetical protein
MAFELPDADFARQLGSGGRVALQGEGTVQGLPVAAPHTGEWDFLQGTERIRERYSVQNPAAMNRKWRLNRNNYYHDNDDCSRDNCLGDFGGIVEIMFQHMPSNTEVINVNSN